MDNVMGYNGGTPHIIELDTRDPIAWSIVWACCMVGGSIALLLLQWAVALLPLDAGVEWPMWLGFVEGATASLGRGLSPAPSGA